ncbi:MAG: UDP-N-acetylmuramate--L-alanine ligase [Proteobacteria bacterium]|nr:UDP-N-acetylmuramate--L-alanine ligase [Pseudomonadota bacterium]
MYNKSLNIHMVGIGGSGMSGIAEVLLNLGHQVNGSDIKETDVTRRLQALGARIYHGHDYSHVDKADVVVYSSAINSENPELKAAVEKMIPIIPRAEMLAELMRMKYGIAVAGTHGKTTTTSLIATVLATGGLDPTVIIGGRLNSYGSSAKLGKGDLMIAEADESDGSFLKLSPIITVVTNIDSDHMDYYTDLISLKEAFVEFNNKVPFYGVNILCLDDVAVQNLIPFLKRRHITYGLTTQADYQAREVAFAGLKSRFQIFYHGENLGEFTAGLPGIHNVQNALAAVVLARELDLDVKTIKKALKEFSGIERRFQIRGEIGGITIVDDYGHHPTEVKCMLNTVKQVWEGRRLVVVFQPHRFTRTHILFNDFLTAFYQADHLVLTSIYPAGEEPIDGVSADTLFRGIKEHGHKSVVCFSESDDIVNHLIDIIETGDIVLTLGAGDVWKVGEALIKRLGKK